MFSGLAIAIVGHEAIFCGQMFCCAFQEFKTARMPRVTEDFFQPQPDTWYTLWSHIAMNLAGVSRSFVRAATMSAMMMHLMNEVAQRVLGRSQQATLCATYIRTASGRSQVCCVCVYAFAWSIAGPPGKPAAYKSDGVLRTWLQGPSFAPALALDRRDMLWRLYNNVTIDTLAFSVFFGGSLPTFAARQHEACCHQIINLLLCMVGMGDFCGI